jgi:hypothetical protein
MLTSTIVLMKIQPQLQYSDFFMVRVVGDHRRKLRQRLTLIADELTVWGVGQRSMESFKAEEIKTLAQMKYYDDRCQKHLLTPWYGDQDAKGFEELSNDERYELFRLKYLEIAQRKV